MKYCSNCGKELLDEATFCSFCGAKQIQESKYDDKDNNLSIQELFSQVNIVPVIVMWAITAFLAVISFGIPIIYMRMSAAAVPFVVSLINLNKSRKILTTKKAMATQIVYAISIILFVLSAFALISSAIGSGIPVFPVLIAVVLLFVFLNKKNKKG